MLCEQAQHAVQRIDLDRAGIGTRSTAMASGPAAALALIATLVMFLVWVPAVEAGPLVLILLVIPLVPAAITIAVLRYQLLDIRLVVSRAVFYGLLTGVVVGRYLGLVAVAELVRREIGIGSSVLATLVIALGFNPVRVRLQRRWGCSPGSVTLRPDVLVLDIQMPDLDGVSAAREITRDAPAVAVLTLTMFDDDESVFAAMRAGARGYVLKGATQEEIVRAIRAVAAGEAIFGPGIARRVLGRLSGREVATTPSRSSLRANGRSSSFLRQGCRPQ